MISQDEKEYTFMNKIKRMRMSTKKRTKSIGQFKMNSSLEYFSVNKL